MQQVSGEQEIVDIRVRRLEQISNSMAESQGKMLHQMQDHPSRLDRIDNRLEVLDARMDKLETRMDKLETRMEKLETRMGRLELRIESLEARLDDLEATTRLGFEKVIMRLERQDEAIGALQRQSEQTQADMAYIKDILLPRALGQTEE